MCRKITKEKQQIKYGFMRRDNQGFTLVEMVVTLVVLSIMLSLSIGGLLAWQDWSDFQKENEYAQTLYIAAQNQLSEFSADGRLAELQESLSGGLVDDKTGNQYEAVGLNLTDSVSLLKDTDGVAYSLDALYPESIGKDNVKKYQDEIVSLRAKTGDYQLYLDDSDGLKASNPEAYWVFELLGAYVYDTSILNGSREGDGSGNGAAICVEITPENGQVFSVLYSDRNDRFIYVGVTGDTFGSTEGDGIADIADRETSYRRERMVGYYGVDSLYTATKNEVIQPSISTVKLYNKDTFYLTCRLSAKYRDILTSQLTYDLDLDASKDVNDKKLTISLDGSKLKNEGHAEAIDCPVFRYDEDGNKIELGEFPVLAWVEPDYTIHVILDAADIQATTYLYDKELGDIRSKDKASDTKFSKTLSFFRFGVAADNVYASVTATGEGFTPSKTVSNFGNLNLFKNQTEKHTCFAGENETKNGDKTAFTYSVKNARHLYNIRYIEDLSYEKEAGSVKDAEKIESVTFVLKSDIDWQEFQKDGQLYNSYDLSNNLLLSSLNERLVDADRKVISNVTRYNCDFPSLSQIRERDVIDGNNKTISGIAVSEISNALYGIYFSDKTGSVELNQMRPTGLVAVNYGEIKELNLDEITASGSDFVGGFCGVNAGKVSKLTTKNEKDNSLIAGKKHVGGIIGFQIPYDNKVELKELINNAEVNGVHAVGGILGMVRNNFELDSFDADELTGLSKQQKNILKNSNALKITISQCENYGAVAGINSSELKEIYTSKEASESTNTANGRTKSSKVSRASDGKDDPQEPRYIGGIVGYCYNVHKNNSENDNARITIEECISAPLYKDEAFLSIVSDEDKLNEKLKGVYVGGIVGYNYYGQIKDCGTSVAKGKEGCLFGYRYVGGIVGFNIGPASVIASTDDSGRGENDNHVVAYQYAGGITGCNANARDVDSDENDISVDGGKDPEKLEGLLLPDSQRDLQVKIDNWINKGVVIAVDEYAGGITGYNAGYIYRCNSDVKYVDAEKFFEKLYSGNYAGGIAGYNNGIIGNTERKINKDNTIGSVIKQGDKFSTVCYVKGHHYVGGIVGYNDVDSVVEDYEIGSGYVLGDEGSCFVGGYAGFNASVDLLMNTTKNKTEARFIHSNPNHVKGTYFVGGNIGGNIINMADNHEVDKINGVFLTDNFLGVLEGKAFVGGFIGYNLLIDNDENTNWIKNDDESYRGGVYIVQRQIIDAFEKSDASVSDAREALLDKKEILDHLSEKLDIDIKPSLDRKVCISGKEATSTKVSFGTISGDVFVGGVLGYNDSDTGLLIQNVENATPIEALNAVKCVDEQILSMDESIGEKTYRTTDYIGRDKTYTYSYAGGIIGKVSKMTELDHCWNASTGTVTTAGTYTGGLCEINEGSIKNCDVSSFGSSTQDYVGGLCGLNKGNITDCRFSKKTVSGRNVVGGIATENFGIISNIELNQAKMLVEGQSGTDEKDGVAGLYAAYNGITGKIVLEKDISDVSVTSGGRYAGLVAGINEGTLENKKAEATTGSDKQLVLNGSIRGYQTVGGLIGLNCNPDATKVIAYYTNKASVIATNGNAGGIIGENLSKNEIRYCVNDAVVTASDAGNAGGITSSNDGHITNCTDYKTVQAPEGMCGGITAINKENGVIENCQVEPLSGSLTLTFISTKAVGGVAAQNAGEISKNRLTNVTLKNETAVQNTSIGIVTGDNLETGKIYLSDSSTGDDEIKNCEIVVQSNYSKVGGIAGTNAGRIIGTIDAATKTSTSVVNSKITMNRASVANIGGVAGVNTGYIADVAVDSVLQGDLGSSKTGYGGVAGFSGYTDKTLLKAAQGNSKKDYPAQILNCSFDGIINASGSSGAPARIGGIVGINGYGSLVQDCYIGARKQGIDGNVTVDSSATYVTAGDYINKTAESVKTTDTKSYSNLGGIAGDNYGKVSACDNAKRSVEAVHIIGFAGETAGIVGYNYPYGVVSGYLDDDGKTEHYLTTGKNWEVEQRCASNDRGPGGIIGKSDSAEDLSYVTNYASVTCDFQSNNYVAGFIGVLEQQYALKTNFYKCDNYGAITSVRSAGGFIGMLKSNGAAFDECNNYGNVYGKNERAAGFIALHHSFVEGLEFRNCANHGTIKEDNTNSGRVAGGFVGKEDLNLANATRLTTVNSYLYNCVNTGIIIRGNGSTVTNQAGSFFGIAQSSVYMELCRNYNTHTGSANGFVGSGSPAFLKNCFDDSNNITLNSDKTPFGGAIQYNITNAYYLDENSKTKFSHDNYGVYFSLHQGAPFYNFRFNNIYYKELRDNSFFFSEPDVSNHIELSSTTPKLKISLSYDESSQGIDSFVIYYWNNNKNRGSAPFGIFTCKATYVYADGSTYETHAGPVQGYYDVCDEARMVLKNDGPNKKPVSIVLDFSGGDQWIRLRGFSYIPAANTGTEAVCNYLSKKNGTSFSIEKLQVAGGNLKTNFDFRNTPTSDTFYNEFPNDALDIDWEDYKNYGLNCNVGQTADITFSVENDTNSTGMEAFVFYLANANTKSDAQLKDRVDKTYNYYVTFTDINGNSVETELVEGAVGYDSGVENYREKSRQVVQIPQGLDAKIASLTLHIQPVNSSKVCFRGFSWIPVGQTEQKMAAGVHSGATKYVHDNTGSFLTHLLVEENSGIPYVYLPYDYSCGFEMSKAANNPIGETYYKDYRDYEASITDSENSGSRIDVYRDIDPKYVEFSEDICTKYSKLKAPTNLKQKEGNSCITYTWDKVANAYAYEVYYKIVDQSGNVIEQSKNDMIGSLQNTYSVVINNSWAENNYRIEFYVRAINGYHPAHDDKDSDDYVADYDKYDSDWVSLKGAVVKKALPKPQVHVEIVAGNRSVFVLDNYDEYETESCTDCTIVVKYNGNDYSWNLSETGKYSSTVRIESPTNNSLANFVYYAKPNSALEDYYISSAQYSQAGEGNNNYHLPRKDWYCTTSFLGFFGTEADSMEYQIVFELNEQDTYLLTDISAYDEKIGATVAYDSEITHAANSYSGGGKVKFTSTLKDLPKEWFSSEKVDKITVRAYPYHSQFNIIHYGHEVAEGIILDQGTEENRAILASIMDSAYIPADGDAPIENCVWDAEKNDLKPGYILQKQDDGTYNLYYSSVVEMSLAYAKEQGDPYREYCKYDVDYRIYSSMSAETAGSVSVNSADYQDSYWSRVWNAHNTVTTNSNERKYIQEIQPSPKVDSAVVSTNEQGQSVYTFKWDTYYQDTACWHTGYKRYNNTENKYITNAPAGMFKTWDSYVNNLNRAGLTNVTNDNMRNMMNAYYNSYSNGTYRIDLVGTTLDGKEVILSTTTVDQSTQLADITRYVNEDQTTSSLTTKDGQTSTTYRVWDYECSFTDTAHTWDAYPLITARIMRLGSLKSVSAYNYNSGNTRTDSNGATYILPRYTETSLKQKLKLNTISKPDVILHRENGQFITNDLLYDISWGAITDEYQKQDLGGYLITVALKRAAEETQQAQTHYYYVKDCQINGDEIGLDLNALETAGVVVSVTDDYICEDDRCSTKINLSDFNTNDIVEISVKAIARKQAEVYENGAEGVSMDLTIPDRLKVPDTEKLSKTLAFDGSNVTDNLVNPINMDIYEDGLAFAYETGTYPAATDAEMKMAVALYTDKPQGAENDKSTVSEAWDAGAKKTLYTKEEPLNLGKVAENHSASIDLTKFERYPGEFAGNWLKIALQATSATKIDSQWTDKDIADRTTNYVWLQIPKLKLDDVRLIDLGATEGKEDVVRYACDGNLSDVSTDVNRETPISTKSLSFKEDRNVNGYSVSVNGIPTVPDNSVPVYNIYMQRHLADENDADSFDGSWDVYLQSNSAEVTLPTEHKPVCEQNAGAVWVGMIGETFDTNPDDDIPADIYPKIPFNSIVMLYQYDSQMNQSCYIPMQLRYQVDEHGKESFVLVMPDVTKVNETKVNETSQPDANFTSKVVVSQYLKEERPYVIGADGIYERTVTQP